MTRLAAARNRAGPWELVVLFKLRIVALLVVSVWAGAFLAAGGWPGPETVALLALTGGLSAAGASLLNEVLERDRDALMRRTRGRPLVGAPQAAWALWLGTALVVGPVAGVATVNPALAAFLFLGAFTYVVVYTLWLKPRTPLNIVIGGAAGSFAVLSGGAAAGAWHEGGVLLLAVLIFLWTPAHFWALASAYREDYARAGVPMLPVVAGTRVTARWIGLHGAAVSAVALAMALHPALGLVYLLPVLPASGLLLRASAGLLAHPHPRTARRFFIASNAYLALVLAAVMVAAWLNGN